MKRITSIFIFFIFTIYGLSQTLVGYYTLPLATPYNSFWGITQINDTLYIGSDDNGKIYKVTKTGIIVDSLVSSFNFNHGLATDNKNFWIARDFTNFTYKLFKINLAGVRLDSISLPNLIGGAPNYFGDIDLRGNGIWFTIYYPDFPTYPFTYAYKVDLTSRTVIDTIPLRGGQPFGITMKGDTIFYINDLFSNQGPERIYAYRKVVGDTLFSFPSPDGDCDPRGLFWDGQYLWLVADVIGAYTPTALYKYAITGAGSPQITTNPNAINFGNVLIGTTSTRDLSITNAGSAPLIISSFQMTNPRFSISPNGVPDTIQVSQSKNYSVSFTPNTYDTTSGQLRISSNDIGQSVKIISLQGKGVYSGAFINLSSNNLNYNERRVGSLCGYSFSVTNSGSAPLQINSVTFSGQRFSFDTLNNQFPIVIDTQRTRVLRFWFNPNATGTFIDSATIFSNAVNSPEFKIYLSGIGQNNLLNLGDILWETQIPANPNTTLQDYQPRSMKQINDVNADGVNDMIIATENYWTICYNGNSSVTGDTLWKFNTHFGSINTGSVDWEDAMQIMQDINGDGVQEVVIGCGGGNEMVYMLSGRTGAKLWEYGNPNTTADGDIYGLRTDRDYNNDAVKDVLISASGETNFTGRHSVICVNGLNGQVIFNTQLPYNFTNDVTTLENGGAIGSGNNGGPYVVKGFNNSGTLTWTYTGITSSVWNIKDFPDLDGDNLRDPIGQSGFAGQVFALSSATGSQIWNISLGSSNNGMIELLDDGNNNGYIDFILSGPQVGHRIDSKTGQSLWNVSFSSSYIRDCANLGDLNGDTVSDVAFSTQQPGRVYVLDGKLGTQLFMYEFGQSISYRADRVAVLNSIDTNSNNEFVAGCRDGRIKCFSGGPVNPIGISNNGNTLPESFALYQNYPNPFNPVTKIQFSVPSSQFVVIKIFDVTGREVATLVKAQLQPGTYEVEWDGANFVSGVYFYRIAIHSDKLTSGDFTDTKKMILLK